MLARVAHDRPNYKYLHIGVPHWPVSLDANCNYTGARPLRRANYTDQARCGIRRVGEFLDKLRQLGLYDSSLIIVSSDHGTDLPPAGFAGRSESLSLVPGPSTVRLPAIASTAKAVMMIKPPNFDPAKKYPVYQFTYGGPHAQSVRNVWGSTRGMFHQLVAQQGVTQPHRGEAVLTPDGEVLRHPLHEPAGHLKAARRLFLWP